MMLIFYCLIKVFDLTLFLLQKKQHLLVFQFKTPLYPLAQLLLFFPLCSHGKMLQTNSNQSKDLLGSLPHLNQCHQLL